MKIYTKTGDRMTTGLLDGTRVSKHDERIHLLGNIDELNSQLGVVKSLTAEPARKEELSGIQRMLMRIMSGIADASQSGDYEKKTASHNPPESGDSVANLSVPSTQASSPSDKLNYQVDAASIAHLEAEIDRMESAFERIKDFVLPGGSFYSAQIDVARTVTRRCERWFAQVAEEYPMDTEAARYLNRLSDYLYVLARYVDASDQEQTQQTPGAEHSLEGQSLGDSLSIEQKDIKAIKDTKDIKDIKDIKDAIGAKDSSDKKIALTAERAQQAVDRLHRQINNSCGTFYTFCVCDAEGKQLATNALAHYSVAVFEAQRSATNALLRAARAAVGTGADAASGQTATFGSISTSGQTVLSAPIAAPGQLAAAGSAAVPEDGGAAIYIQGQLTGSVGVYGSYKKDINEKAQMLLDLLCFTGR
ncbi:MAG: ATP:cob(I)alamin adenosyltransferase [Lachnospiraceae bacterium]|nr:ATP:cob(I)alamin adenosyltransferase [Lachnospiraceae bacterium]